MSCVPLTTRSAATSGVTSAFPAASIGAPCHGAGGRGDGPASRASGDAPFDLTTQPLRRPRATDTRTLDAAAIAADRASPILSGTWPGRGDPMAAVVFGAPIAAQGSPPPSVEPSLAARSCGRCHTKQHREWQGSIHGQSRVARRARAARSRPHAREERVVSPVSCAARRADDRPRTARRGRAVRGVSRAAVDAPRFAAAVAAEARGTQALARARGSRYIGEQRTIEIAR